MKTTEEKIREWLRPGTPQCGVLCALLGAVVAFLLLWAGFWKTLFIVLLAALGAFLGGVQDKKESIRRVVNRLFPPRNDNFPTGKGNGEA